MGDEERFLSAFENYADQLFRHVSFRISDRERAKDLVQDAFMKTWDYVGKGNKVEDYRAFLYRTLNNLIIDEYRKRSHDSLDAILEAETVSEGSFSELVVEGRESVEIQIDARATAELLAEMPEQYRVVVVMRFIDGLSPKEIAETLGDNVNAISVRIHRGVGWLKKRIETQS